MTRDSKRTVLLGFISSNNSFKNLYRLFKIYSKPVMQLQTFLAAIVRFWTPHLIISKHLNATELYLSSELLLLSLLFQLKINYPGNNLITVHLYTAHTILDANKVCWFIPTLNKWAEYAKFAGLAGHIQWILKKTSGEGV